MVWVYECKIQGLEGKRDLLTWNLPLGQCLNSLIKIPSNCIWFPLCNNKGVHLKKCLTHLRNILWFVLDVCVCVCIYCVCRASTDGGNEKEAVGMLWRTKDFGLYSVFNIEFLSWWITWAYLMQEVSYSGNIEKNWREQESRGKKNYVRLLE